jgi:hypothetical protein
MFANIVSGQLENANKIFLSLELCILIELQEFYYLQPAFTAQ